MSLPAGQVSRNILALDHPDPARREEAAASLRKLSFDRIPLLGQELSRVSTPVRRRLLDVIRSLDDERLTLALMRFIYDFRETLGEEDNRGLAMRHLVDRACEDGPRAAQLVEFGRDMRHDRDRFIRGLVFELFARLRRREVIPFVEEGLGDADEFVRVAAIAAAAALPASSLVEPLTRALPPGDAFVNVRAAIALSQPDYLAMLGSMPEVCARLSPPLHVLFESGGIDRVDVLIPLLALVPRHEAKPLLEELAADPVPLVRDRARDVMRLWRNEAPFIDVDYEPR